MGIFKRSKTLGRFGTPLFLLLCLVTVIGIAGTYNFLVAIGTTDNVTISTSFSANDGQGGDFEPAEDYTLTFTPTLYGGQTATVEFGLRYNGGDQMSVQFIVTNSDTDALTVEVLDETLVAVTGWTAAMVNEEAYFELKVTADDYVTAGVYTVMLQVDYV